MLFDVARGSEGQPTRSCGHTDTELVCFSASGRPQRRVPVAYRRPLQTSSRRRTFERGRRVQLGFVLHLAVVLVALHGGRMEPDAVIDWFPLDFAPGVAVVAVGAEDLQSPLTSNRSLLAATFRPSFASFLGLRDRFLPLRPPSLPLVDWAVVCADAAPGEPATRACARSFLSLGLSGQWMVSGVSSPPYAACAFAFTNVAPCEPVVSASLSLGQPGKLALRGRSPLPDGPCARGAVARTRGHPSVFEAGAPDAAPGHAGGGRIA